MAIVSTSLHKVLATVGLTSFFSLFLYGFANLAQAQPLTFHKPKLPNQQFNLLKCGYKKKQINLKLPEEKIAAQASEMPVNRVEMETDSRCNDYQPPIGLTALIPNTNSGVTLSKYPAFFFYIPDVNLDGVEGELTLRNEQNELIYKKTVPLTTSDSIVRVEFANSPSLPALEVGKSYYWVFSLLLDKVDRSSNRFVTGWIKRIEPNSELRQKLGTASHQAYPAVYANNGIWYEALDSIAKLRCTSPTDSVLASNWQSLLQQVGLPEISHKPLAECN